VTAAATTAGSAAKATVMKNSVTIANIITPETGGATDTTAVVGESTTEHLLLPCRPATAGVVGVCSLVATAAAK
jgi:hypothetical protein